MLRRSASLVILAFAALAFFALPSSVALGATPAIGPQTQSCPSDEWCDLYFAQPVECTVCIYQAPEPNLWNDTTSRMIDFCECSISTVWDSVAEPAYEFVTSNWDTIVETIFELWP